MIDQPNEHSIDTIEPTESEPLLPSYSPQPQPKKEFIGLILSATSALLFSIMSVLVKKSGQFYTSFQIVFVRSVLQLVFSFISCQVVGVNPFGPVGLNKLLLYARGFFGATGLAFYFFTLINMPLGDGTTIFFTGPAITSVAAHLILKEPLHRLDVISIVFCLIGVVLVAKPEFNYTGYTGYTIPAWIPILTAFGGAFASAGAYCLVRVVGGRVHYMVHVFYFGFVSTFISFIVLAMTNQLYFNDLDCHKFILLLSVGLLAFTAQCFLNAGLQLANAGPATLMRNLDIVFAFIFGTIFFGEIPQITSIIGGILIAGVTSTVAVIKYKAN
jgi:drug/metabolite transporter (DMT)-like permease